MYVELRAIEVLPDGDVLVIKENCLRKEPFVLEGYIARIVFGDQITREPFTRGLYYEESKYV